MWTRRALVELFPAAHDVATNPTSRVVIGEERSPTGWEIGDGMDGIGGGSPSMVIDHQRRLLVPPQKTSLLQVLIVAVDSHLPVGPITGKLS
jgi:hypothetical protein